EGLESFFAVGDNSRKGLVDHVGELRRTTRAKRHHGDASWLAEAIARNRHFLTGLAFVRNDLFDLGPLLGAVGALRQTRRFRRLGLRALDSCARLRHSVRRLALPGLLG